MSTTNMSLTTENGTVTISVNKDDMTLFDLFDQVIKPLLLAAGYSEASINELTSGD